MRLPEDFASRARELLRSRFSDVEHDPKARRWLLRLIVLHAADSGARRETIGFVGFHGRPDREGRLEVGYEVFAPYRRRGYAREAVLAILDWAWRRDGFTRFLAAIAPDNEPSMRLALGLGFRQVGAQVDEDDALELLYEVEWPRARRQL